jgi:hypothetical protein
MGNTYHVPISGNTFRVPDLRGLTAGMDKIGNAYHVPLFLYPVPAFCVIIFVHPKRG